MPQKGVISGSQHPPTAASTSSPSPRGHEMAIFPGPPCLFACWKLECASGLEPPALPPPGCVASEKSLNLSVPRAPSGGCGKSWGVLSGRLAVS